MALTNVICEYPGQQSLLIRCYLRGYHFHVSFFLIFQGEMRGEDKPYELPALGQKESIAGAAAVVDTGVDTEHPGFRHEHTRKQ